MDVVRFRRGRGDATDAPKGLKELHFSLQANEWKERNQNTVAMDESLFLLS